jgi:hypothetical protein
MLGPDGCSILHQCDAKLCAGVLLLLLLLLL